RTRLQENLGPGLPQPLAGVMMLDLVKGEPVTLFDLPGKYASVSPDGRYLFTQGGENLQRYRIEGRDLIWEETSPPIARGLPGPGICIGPDSKHLSLVSHSLHRGFGNVTDVFALKNLQQPAFRIVSEHWSQSLGFAFDPKRGHVFSHVANKPIEVYSY